MSELCRRKSNNTRMVMEALKIALEDLRELLISRFDILENKIEIYTKNRMELDGEKLLDNQDMCLLLGITKRSLASYRHKKLIRYYQIDRKVFYKASEIEEFLKKRGKNI